MRRSKPAVKASSISDGFMYTSSSNPSLLSKNQAPRYRVYKRRYYMLFIYCLITLFNSMCRIHNNHYRIFIRDAYGASELSSKLSSVLYPIMFTPGVIVATIIYNKYSLRTGLIIAAALQAFGWIFKTLINFGFFNLFIGQVLCALANPFIVLVTATFATTWFEDSKRVMTIAIGATFHTLGIVDGYGILSLLINFEEQDLDHMRYQIVNIFIVYAAVGWLILVLVLFTFQSEPEIPPSSSSSEFRDDDILGTYRQLFLNRNFMLLTASHIFYFASVASILINLATLDRIFDLHEDYVSYIQLIFVGAGAIGNLVLGFILHKSRIYKTTNVLIGLIGALATWTLVFTLPLETKWDYLSAGLIGFFIFPSMANCYVYSSEIVYPLKESTCWGVFLWWGEIIGYLFAYAFWFLTRNVDTQKGGQLSVIAIVAILLLGSFISMMMKPVSAWGEKSAEYLVTNSFAKKYNHKINI